jgi:hypothetical protein
MSRIVDTFVDPFEGLAASIITSNSFDLRHAVSWTLSWYTTAGTTSQHTLQISNWSNPALASSVSTGYVNYTTFGTGTPAVIEPPTGVRYGRVLRTASGASVVVDIARQEG